MKRFLTVYLPCENIHLVKDVGMIPYMLQKDYGFESTIASYRNGSYPYLDKEVKGLKQVFIKKVFNVPLLDTLLFLLLNFRRYDILQLYHFKWPVFLTAVFFKGLKIFSRSATVYLKLDADDRIFMIQIKGIRLMVLKRLCSCIDLVSVESKAISQYLNTTDFFNKEVVYLPNGFYTNNERRDIIYAKKDNVILTVGRIGSFQKSNETLIIAFEQFSRINKDWTLILAGSLEPGFESYLQDFFERFPILAERIVITGHITNRTTLKELYDRAKLFVLTSKYEGFPLVFLEAMQSGCTVLSTQFSAAKDITDNGKYGALFPVDDAGALTGLLNEYTRNEELMAANCAAIQEYGYTNFYWPVICKKLTTLLNVISNSK